MPEPGLRSLPRSCRDWLAAELAYWEAEGLVTPQQGEAIRRLYRWEEESARSRTTATVSILGAVLLGLGAILFVAANWPEIPRPWRVALLLGATLGSHGLGWWLWQEQARYPRVGHALVLLGNLLYGAGIWQIGQMYHLEIHWSAGFLAWALGCLAVAWAAGSRPGLAMAALLLVAWNVAEQTALAGANPLLPALLGVAGVAAYRLGAPESLAVAQGGLAIWLATNLHRWQLEVEGGPQGVVVGLAALGAGLMAAGMAQECQERHRPMAWPFLLAGGALGLLALFLGTFLTPSDRWVLEARSLGLLAGTGLLALGTALWALRRLRETAPAPWQRAAPLAAAAPAVLAPVLLALLPAGGPVRIGFNLLLLAAILGLLAYGYGRRNQAAVNLALVAFVAQVLARYFDLFWQVLDRSLFFMAGGVLLLAVGSVLERSRRRWLREWQGGEGR
ncbi:MAG: DUF2157 domain-containing protein [Bacillota bacterium]